MELPLEERRRRRRKENGRRRTVGRSKKHRSLTRNCRRPAGPKRATARQPRMMARKPKKAIMTRQRGGHRRRQRYWACLRMIISQ